MKEDNLKVIHNEVAELHKYQQSGVDLLYNKLNWILVSDLVFLAAAYNLHRPDFLALLLASASAILVLIKFQPETFKSTAQISAQLEQVESKDFLESLIKKKKEAFNANDARIDKLGNAMFWARVLLIAAIAVQFLSIMHVYVR